MAKFRLGNEMGGDRYWKTEEKRKYRVCGRKEKMWEDVWEEYADWGREKSWQEMIRRF